MQRTWNNLWSASAPLCFVGLLMIVALAGSLAGLWFDPRMITGAPAWLKPAKFSASSGIFCLTLAWLFTWLHVWPKLVRALGWLIASIIFIEVALIDLQAARGATSHFNTSTPFDQFIYITMGTSIGILWLATMVLTVALWRQPFLNQAWAWSLRSGLMLMVLGAGVGALMTSPTSAQLQAAGANQPLKISGAHTVGGPDGGPGLPGTGWSTQHGDLRVPHFMGLHALQIMPLLGWLILGSRRNIRSKTALVQAAAAGYFSLFLILVWQALRGQSVLRPDGLTVAVLAIWALATTAAAWKSVSQGRLLALCYNYSRD